MKKWRVCIAYQAVQVIEIRAETEDQAKIEALLTADASLCWECRQELELSEPLEVIDIEENK